MTNLIAFLGIQKDSRGTNKRRWESFRPSVSICMHEDLKIKNYYILYQEKFQYQLELLTNDIKKVSPETNIIPVEINFTDPYDPLEALEKQLEFVSSLDDKEKYTINITTGTHTNQIAWFKLVENNFIDAKLIQNFTVSKRKKQELGMSDKEYSRGYYKIIDFKLEKYDRYFTLLNDSKIKSEDFLKSGIQTFNSRYNEMISMIERISIKSNDPLLIDGPSGAGKTQLAKNIYNLKKSKGIISGDFQYINCATIQYEHAQSILFGHKKGAFTGALSSRNGLLKEANKGVLFLDEIGTLPLGVQGMLLDAIESKKFKPLGSDNFEHSDFILICGTNVDLYDSVKKGNFRDDLLARIDLWHFTLPGLSERKEDIEPNIQYEIEKYEVENKVKIRFNNQAKQNYLRFSNSENALWNRNFRDLTSSIKRMITLSEDGFITSEIVNDEISRLKRSWAIESDNSISKLEDEDRYSDYISEAYIGKEIDNISLIDLMVLEKTISVCISSKNASEAAKKLYGNKEGISLSQNPSGRLNKFLSKYGLSYKQLKK